MAWELLFGSESGLFSLFVILATIVMSFAYARYFAKKMNERPSQEK